jgi:hypothetical protein
MTILVVLFDVRARGGSGPVLTPPVSLDRQASAYWYYTGRRKVTSEVRQVTILAVLADVWGNPKEWPLRRFYISFFLIQIKCSRQNEQ